jgi:hypothetical protein
MAKKLHAPGSFLKSSTLRVVFTPTRRGWRMIAAASPNHAPGLQLAPVEDSALEGWRSQAESAIGRCYFLSVVD